MSYEVGAITSFTDEYFFLSNFAPTPFVWRNYTFPTSEHAFMCAKSFFSNNDGDFERILSAPTPGLAKKAGRSIKIDVSEWDKRRVSYMKEIVHAKFASGTLDGKGLVGPLCNTGMKMLIEGNNWGDKFWGRVQENGKWTGLNVLGVILMEERGYWKEQPMK